LKIGKQLLGARIPGSLVDLQAPEDDPAEIVGDAGVEGMRIDRAMRLVLESQGQSGLGLEREDARQHEVHCDAQGEDVAALVHGLAIELFGRHVARRPHGVSDLGEPHPLLRPGQPKVHDLDVPLPVDHEILRLQVPVDDTESVDLGQSLADLPGDMEAFLYGQLAQPPDHVAQVLAGDVLHGDEEGRALFAEVIHPANAGMGDPPGDPQLGPEALDGLLVDGDLGVDEFQGHFFADLGVVDPINAAHAALADLVDHEVSAGEQDAVREDPRGVGEGRGVPGIEGALWSPPGSPAAAADLRIPRHFEQTAGAFHGTTSFNPTSPARISGRFGKINTAIPFS